MCKLRRKSIAKGLDLDTEVRPCPLASGNDHTHWVRLTNYLQNPLRFKFSSTPDLSGVTYGNGARTWELEFDVLERDDLQPDKGQIESIRYDGVGIDNQVTLKLEFTRWSLRPISAPEQIDGVNLLVSLKP